MTTLEIPEIPRPEHPRPDFHRGLHEGRDWICLNGWWQFDFAGKRAGMRQGWHKGEGELARRIRVPFPWQSHAAWGTEAQAGNDNWFSLEAFLEPGAVSVDDRSYRNAPQHEVGWYRRRMDVPPQWLGEHKRIYLNIGAADWEVAVWVNGRRVGAAESGYLPVSFDITDQLAAEESNLLVVRVWDPMNHRQQPVGKQYNWYTRTSGIWQTVWLEPRPPAHVRAMKIYPDATTGLVRVRARLWAPDPVTRARASVEISIAGQPVTQASAAVGEVEAGEHEVEIAVKVPTVRLWSPEEPVLYDLSLALQYNEASGRQHVDVVNGYFGFRSVTVAPLYAGGPNYVCLNGQPVYLRGNLNQSFNPWGVYTFPTDEAIRRDIEQAKESGWNFIRLHIKLEDPRWYYWADRLGVLVMQDMPNFGYDGWSDKALQRWERTLRGAIERDFNHPCIIAWCLFNETWGLGGQQYKDKPKRQQWVEQMYYLAKRLDPTRLVEDNSACLYDHVITDINSWHFYINDYEAAAEHIKQVVERTYPGSGFNYVPGRAARDEPLMNSEYGGISAGMGDMDVSWCFRFLTNELRYHTQICGYVYTEQMDIEWERNGFYNYDRTPKEFGYNPALLQAEQFVGITGPPSITAPAGEPVRLSWWLRGPAPKSAARIVVRAQRYNSLAEMDAHWQDTIAIGDWDMAGIGEHPLELPLELTARPGLVWVWLELLNDDSHVLAGNWAVVEVVGEGASDAVLHTVDLGAVIAGDWDGGEVEKGEVDGAVQLLAGRGQGFFEFAVPVPEASDGLALLAELSSARPGAGIPQTDADAYPTEVVCQIQGRQVYRAILGNQYADSRGALSHMHGFAGRYGEPVRIDVPAAAVAEARRNDGEMRVRLAVPEDADHPGGLTIYGPRAGRYPCGLALIRR